MSWMLLLSPCRCETCHNDLSANPGCQTERCPLPTAARRGGGRSDRHAAVSMHVARINPAMKSRARTALKAHPVSTTLNIKFDIDIEARRVTTVCVTLLCSLICLVVSQLTDNHPRSAFVRIQSCLSHLGSFDGCTSRPPRRGSNPFQKLFLL